MNITLYPQDFTQGAITINGNIGNLKQIRTPEYILLDDTWNFQDLTIAVTFKSEINKTPKIALFGYESLDTSRSCFNKTYSGSPYVQELTSYPKVKYIRMHIGFDDNTDILPDDIETVTISSECTWIMTNDGIRNTKFIETDLLGVFANAKDLQEVSIPRSVKKIGRYSFANTQLKSVTIAKDCKYYNTSFPKGCKINFYP